jgi:hypothetical protein
MRIKNRPGSPRVHPSHSLTLAERRSPSRSASTTSSNFKDAPELLLEDAAWGLPHAAVLDKSRTTSESGALQAHLNPALTFADLARSARPETSRFPTTRTAPRFAPATSAQRKPELATAQPAVVAMPPPTITANGDGDRLGDRKGARGHWEGDADQLMRSLMPTSTCLSSGEPAFVRSSAAARFNFVPYALVREQPTECAQVLIA